MRTLLILCLMLPIYMAADAQPSLSGVWEGAITIQGQQLNVVFNIDGEPQNYSGTIDIPQQGAMGLDFTRVEQKADSVFFTFFTGQGDGDFEGELKSDSLIAGTYIQGAVSFPFEVKKQRLPEVPEMVLGKGKELIISAETVEIGGTLVTPENSDNSPLVILVSGSGAQSRDSDVFGFKIFAQMAEQLRQDGISSFRYDDRQTGKSSGSFPDASLDMLASDVNAVVDHFKNYENSSFSEIILLGHSQGGVVAGKAAVQNPDVDRLVLMASTGVSLKEVLRFQVKQAYGQAIHSEKAVEKEITLREELMAAIRDGENVEKARQNYIEQYRAMIESLPEPQKAGIPDIEAFVKQQADQLVIAYSSPQTKSLLFYDPAQDLKELEVPVLVLFGEKDTQVTISLNRKPIENALDEAGVSYEVAVIQDANHLFQKANSGQVSEYTMLEKNFTDGFLDKITGWIKDK